MNYHEYLRSDKWLRLRDAALRQAKHRCQLCNRGNGLNVHHRKYPKVFGTEPLTDLIVLCLICHKTFHARRYVQDIKPVMTGKISTGRRRYHLWIKTTNVHEFRTVCDPNITRSLEGIFPPSAGNGLCKRCSVKSTMEAL